MSDRNLWIENSTPVSGGAYVPPMESRARATSRCHGSRNGNASLRDRTSLQMRRSRNFTEHEQDVESAGEPGIKRGWRNPSLFQRLGRYDGNSRGWRPFSLTAPILIGIVIMNVLLVASIESLAQKSKGQGGLALSPSASEIPSSVMMAYLYLPNTVAVLYSLLWTWVDHDVKRMQPWFELSKDTGAPAQDSLFLDYLYDFVAMVPVKAARRKHWPVFFAGLTMVMVLWIITPLQSAVFATASVSKNETASIVRSQLIPVQEQTPLFDPRMMMTAYAVGWLGQSLPPFTSMAYALSPFAVHGTNTTRSGSTNYTAKTTKLSTELECWPAEFDPSPPNQISVNNGRGCNASLSLSTGSNSIMVYAGYHSSAYSDQSLGGPSCKATASSVHQFAAVWAKADIPKNLTQQNPKYDVTAIFCQPHYYKQTVLATVASDTLKPFEDSVQPLSPRQTLSASEFNVTAFEYLLANGMDSDPTKYARDGPYRMAVDQGSRIAPLGLGPSSNMVGFALAGQNRSTSDYRDRKVLREVYNRAHQYIFSVAMSYLWENVTSNPGDLAVLSTELTGIVVSRTFSALVEALLVLTAVSALVIFVIVQKTPCLLQKNPSSISRLMDIFRASPDVANIFQGMSNADEETLKERFQHDKYRAVINPDSTSSMDGIIIERVPGSHEPDKKATGLEEGYYTPVKPLVLRPTIGVLFVFVIFGAVIGLAYLKSEESRSMGLRRPTDNFNALQILENYVPTMFATLVEPFWVLLSRLLCSLQPFKDLWKGKSKPSKSIGATYSSIPPQLVFSRAIKKKHFVLAFVSTMAILSNVLAIALGALFNERQVGVSYSQEALPLRAHRLQGPETWNIQSKLNPIVSATTQYQDHFYVVLANITRATRLPPWTTEDYFFSPFELHDNQTLPRTDKVHVLTRGYGLQPYCKAYPASEISRGAVPIDDLNTTTCSDEMHMSNAGARLRQSNMYPTSDKPRGKSSNELPSRINGGAGSLNPCSKVFTFAWARTDHGQDANRSATASYLVCRPVFQTGLFNVTVDTSGYVLSYRPTSSLSEELDYPESRNHTDSLIINANSEMSDGDKGWHNDAFSRNWMNYLIYTSTGSRLFLDPHQPPPDPQQLKPTVEKIYRALFAVLLSRDQQLFAPDEAEKPIKMVRVTRETRIFMDISALIVTFACLGLNIIAAAILYVRAVVFVLPRMPTTIGSVLAYVAPSRALRGQHHELRMGKPRTFSFGRFVGRDGKVHLGVEMDPHVVPIDPDLLGDGSSSLGLRRIFRLGQKGHPKPSGPWI